MTRLTSALLAEEENRPELSGRGEIPPIFADVLGVRVTAVNMQVALDLADRWIAAGNPGYACFSSVHPVIEAQRDPDYLEILNGAAFNFPDGMPLTWIGRIQGHADMDRVFGPEFMLEMCRLSEQRGYRNFLYGGYEGTAAQLRDSLQQRYPRLQIVGVYTPPFRSLTAHEEEHLIATVREARPHILWVGIGAPKQDRFMARFVDRLNVPLMAGVGAAFDFHTGRIRDCSEWIKRAGLQWAHRLIQDPKRLWKRYALANPAFLWHVAWQLSGLRSYPNRQK